MSFEALDINMHRFETPLDRVVLPSLYLVVCIDGRNFTRPTKEICGFEVSFDTRFGDTMTDTVKYLAECGFRIVHGYTQSDEIPPLFHPDDRIFGRKIGGINLVLVGEASAFFLLKLGVLACFGCHVVLLPSLEYVKDYFAWRQEDAHRNPLNAHRYWLLRQEGKSAQEVTKEIEGKSVFLKNELFSSRNTNYNDLPG